MEAGFTPKLQRGAQLERDYGELDRAVFTPEPRQLLAQQNNTPTAVIRAWSDVEKGLIGPRPGMTPAQAAHGRGVRNQIVARIIHNYQADPGRIAAILQRIARFRAGRRRRRAGGAAAGRGPWGRQMVPPRRSTRCCINGSQHSRPTSQQEKQRREAAE